MITSASCCGKTLVLRDESEPNIFPIDSASIVIGDPGSGKSTFLVGIANSIIGSACGQNEVKLHYSDSEEKGRADWVACYFNPSRFDMLSAPNIVNGADTLGQYDHTTLVADYPELLEMFGLDVSSGSREMNNSKRNLLDIACHIELTLKNASGNKLLVLLDNAECGMHPRWQRNFINFVVTLLKDCKKLHKLKLVQLVIASDSAFVIGDFPSKYACLLRKEYWRGNAKVENFSTFAASLQDIMNVPLSVSTIPQFATNTINKTIDELKKGKCSNHDDFVISIIGDPIIKRSVIAMK